MCHEDVKFANSAYLILSFLNFKMSVMITVALISEVVLFSFTFFGTKYSNIQKLFHQLKVLCLKCSFPNCLVDVDSFFKTSSPKDMFIDFREKGEARDRGREGEREIDMREKHRAVASCMCPDWGLNSQPRYVP